LLILILKVGTLPHDFHRYFATVQLYAEWIYKLYLLIDMWLYCLSNRQHLGIDCIQLIT